MNFYMMDDTRRLVPVILVVVSILMALGLRSVTGIVLPGPLPELRAEAVASVAHVVHRWDNAGLAAAAHLIERVPVRAVDNGAPGTELFSSLCDAAWARL